MRTCDLILCEERSFFVVFFLVFEKRHLDFRLISDPITYPCRKKTKIYNKIRITRKVFSAILLSMHIHTRTYHKFILRMRRVGIRSPILCASGVLSEAFSRQYGLPVDENLTVIFFQRRQISVSHPATSYIKGVGEGFVPRSKLAVTIRHDPNGIIQLCDDMSVYKHLHISFEQPVYLVRNSRHLAQE